MKLTCTQSNAVGHAIGSNLSWVKYLDQGYINMYEAKSDAKQQGQSD